MRSSCIPHLVDGDSRSVPLERLNFSDKAIDEGFLQDRLDKCPSLIPVDRIEGDFGPLISLGREILSIDNLFVSPAGRLTVVETKLWRNPEAVRQVVAQLLEYASRLSVLAYEEFETECRRARQPAPVTNCSLYDLVSRSFPGEVSSEAIFIDGVQRNLRNGRFLLLIAGDGIQENLEGLVRMIHQHPQRHFTLGLVELQVYRSSALPGLLVVPQLIARTVEIVRAVVRVEGPADVKVAIELPTEASTKKTTLGDLEFLDSIADAGVRDAFARLLVYANEVGVTTAAKRSITVRIPVRDVAEFRIFRLWREGTLEFSNLGAQFEDLGLPGTAAPSLARALVDLFPTVTLAPHGYKLSRRLEAKEVSLHVDEILDAFQDVVGKLKSETLASQARAMPRVLRGIGDEDDEA